MADDLVPFGKYKGQPIEVLQADRSYCEWLAGQDWFRDRFGSIHTLIVNHFGQPAETPEHNRLQARFLDRAMRVALVRLIAADSMLRAAHDFLQDVRRDKAADVAEYTEAIATSQYNYPAGIDYCRRRIAVGEALIASVDQVLAQQPWPGEVTDPLFEQKGADIEFTATLFVRGSLVNASRSRDFRIECKPALGDDYPAVLRQMQANTCNVLVIDTFTATGATLDQVRQIFAPRWIVTLDELTAAHT